MSDPECELCGRTGPALPHFADLGIVRCPRCDLVYYEVGAPLPELYTKDYFHGGEYPDYVGDRSALQRNFAARVRHLRRLRPAPRDGSRQRLLEIGCAYGFFLDLARRHWDVRGVDVVPEAAAYARDTLGLDVAAGEFLELPDEPEGYDFICLWDTIEHLPRPARTIEKAARWLKPGGLLAMTTGDIGSFLARVRGPSWRLIHPPTHLYYFTPKTLGRAAEQAGLAVRHVSHVGYTRSLRFILHWLVARRLGAAWLYSVLTLGGRVDAPIYLNTYDVMLLVAEKPSSPRAP